MAVEGIGTLYFLHSSRKIVRMLWRLYGAAMDRQQSGLMFGTTFHKGLQILELLLLGRGHAFKENIG